MTLLLLCSDFVLCSWAEVGFSGKRWICCGIGFAGQLGRVSAPTWALKTPAWLPQVFGLF